MLFSFNENFPQDKQHVDRVCYKWISCYCTYYFLNAYVFESLLCVNIAKMLHPFVTNSSMLISVGLYFFILYKILSAFGIAYLNPG